MINYEETSVGDVLRIVGAGAPGYAENGDLVRVVSVHKNSVSVEDRDGEKTEFLYNCGAARLEATEWKEYAIRVGPVTVDAATINFVAATFSIERTGGALALLKGTNSLANIEFRMLVFKPAPLHPLSAAITPSRTTMMLMA